MAEGALAAQQRARLGQEADHALHQGLWRALHWHAFAHAPQHARALLGCKVLNAVQQAVQGLCSYKTPPELRH